nr:protein YeeZ isoform X2 [Populus alba]
MPSFPATKTDPALQITPDISQSAMEIYQVKIPARFPLQAGCFPSNSKKKSTFLRRVAAFTTSSHSLTDKSESESQNRMFILGMGFVCQFFAQSLKKEGWVVTGTCTSKTKKKHLEEKGFHVHLLDANQPELSTLDALKCYTHLLVSIPPVGCAGDPMLQHAELLRSTLLDGNLQWLCYLSSTSVYGHCDGAWVDEDYPTSPTSELAKLRLDAEEGWLNLGQSLGFSTQVFRLGGIYGPGRSAVDTIIKQEPQSEGQKMRKSRQYTSRVHVEDICQALKASIYTPSSSFFAPLYLSTTAQNQKPCRRTREREERIGREERTKLLSRSVSLFLRKKDRSMPKCFACSEMVVATLCVLMGPSVFATFEGRCTGRSGLMLVI